MKTIPIIILAELCESLCASDFKLSLENGIIGSNLPDTPIDLYASSDLRGWKLVRSFTNSTKVSGSNYFRARVRPLPPDIRVETTVRGTLASLYGTASKPLSSLWLTNGMEAVQGRVTRQHIESNSCDFVFPPFNTEGGQVQLALVDIDNNTVRTNVILNCTASIPMAITFPLPGASVVGSAILVTGTVERNDSLVWVDTGDSVYLAVVREGRFVTGKIPMKAVNHWEIHCISDIYDEVVEEVSFTKSPVTISYTMENWTKVYGERGISLKGTVSDPAYDVMVGTNVISTTNGNWQIKIVPPEGGMLPFSVKPKMSLQNTSASGLEFIDVGMTSYCYSEVMSYNYYAKDHTNTIMSSFCGWDEHNSLWYRRLKGRDDCTILYKGVGEYLLLDGESDCASPQHRALYPNTYIGNYFDGVIGCNVQSSLKINLGGDPNDTTKYRVVVDLVLYGVIRRDEDDVWLSEDPVSNSGWRVGGNETPWTFEAYSGLQVDATPTPPPFYNGWAYYDLSIEKTPINK